MNTTRSFSAYNLEEGIRLLSSSGGIFYILAEKILSEGGLVFGAAFDDDWQVHHKSCSKLEELPRIMQSKYVQSSTGDSYCQVKEAILNQKKVLFCGTPCQVKGLLSYLENALNSGEWRNYLLTVDFICHGVPSRMVWRKYITELADGREIKNINFRDKQNGWRDFSLRVDFTDGTSYNQSHNKDIYVRGFLKNLYLRDSCYACQFRGIERVSDFTIADFWGVHKLLPEFYDDKGTSIVMTHNERALKLLEELQGKLRICEIENELVAQTNTPVVKSVPRNSKRKTFFEQVGDKNISFVISNNLKQPLSRRIINKLKRMLGS